ncbi:MAG: carboxypeptidase regulatory-like domain-containing protein [Planctomycetota bacterium]|nr:MAG: carboxypeptidase regulatory-like domain-containing protein [Planctomycetota bacterium]
MKALLRSASLFILLLASISPLWAHRLLVFPAIAATHIEIHASFGRNAPAIGAQVTVYTADGEALHRGHTDERGHFRFPTPAPQNLLVVVDDGAGHRSEQRITADRLAPFFDASRAAEPSSSQTTMPAAAASGNDTIPMQDRLDALEARIAQLELESHQRLPWERFLIGLLALFCLSLFGWAWAQARACKRGS